MTKIAESGPSHGSATLGPTVNVIYRKPLTSSLNVKRRRNFSSFTCPEVRIVDVRTQNTERPKTIREITSDNRLPFGEHSP